MDHTIFRSLLQVDDIPRIPSISVRRQSGGGTSDQGYSSETSVFEASPTSTAGSWWRWCTNRNWHATVPTTGASSTDGVGSWAAHIDHRIQHIARELRFDRSPTGCPGSKTIADDRRIPEAGVLDSRVLMVA